MHIFKNLFKASSKKSKNIIGVDWINETCKIVINVEGDNRYPPEMDKKTLIKILNDKNTVIDKIYSIGKIRESDHINQITKRHKNMPENCKSNLQEAIDNANKQIDIKNQTLSEEVKLELNLFSYQDGNGSGKLIKPLMPQKITFLYDKYIKGKSVVIRLTDGVINAPDVNICISHELLKSILQFLIDPEK